MWREAARAIRPAVLVASVLSGCAGTPPSAHAPAGPAGLANPASRHCIARGGALAIEKDGSGGEYGVCGFPDGRQCEEWAILRGVCPDGGIQVTGYATAAARYCAIRGGRYAVTGATNTPDERGTCILSDGQSCDARAYYDGRCGR
jgi:putative hemolysin